MIKNDEQITEYKNHNKIYIPQEYINNNNKYTLENDTITIITNNNCTTNYNTTTCECYRYNMKYNIITNAYQCNRNPNNYILNNNIITSDINNSSRITKDYVNEYIIMGIIIIIAILMTTMLKRNSRNI